MDALNKFVARNEAGQYLHGFFTGEVMVYDFVDSPEMARVFASEAEAQRAIHHLCGLEQSGCYVDYLATDAELKEAVAALDNDPLNGCEEFTCQHCSTSYTDSSSYFGARVMVQGALPVCVCKACASNGPVQAGDIVTFKPEYQDEGDSEIEFVAVDNEDRGHFKVRAMIGLTINPVQVVTRDMVARIN